MCHDLFSWDKQKGKKTWIVREDFSNWQTILKERNSMQGDVEMAIPNPHPPLLLPESTYRKNTSLSDKL